MTRRPFQGVGRFHRDPLKEQIAESKGNTH